MVDFTSEAETEELKEMVEEMDGSSVNFSEWEREFLSSLIDEWDGCYTEKQANRIRKIYKDKM